MRDIGSILLDPASRSTLQGQITWQVKELIRQGALRPGEALPSSRELALQLRVSRNTVVYAYDRLMSEGYLEPRPRSGVFVSPAIPLPPRPRPGRDLVRALAFSASRPAPKSLGSPTPFRPCQPDVHLFPLFIWNRLRGRALRAQGRNLLHYQASCTAGFPPLCEILAAYLRDSRGVRCDWRQVVITSGSQQALYILANLLLKPGNLVYMEDPGYREARQAWQKAGANIHPGPIDGKGLTLPPDSRGKRFRLIYATPSRQFPTGASLSLERRFAFIDLAARAKTWIIEDDYDSELRYGARPLPSLQSLDHHNRVIYVGTFSKLLFPSLRLGYVVVPEPLLDAFVKAKHLIDDHLPLIDQATLASFLESGAFYSHVRRCRKAYAERQHFFLNLFRESNLPLDFKYADGGMNLAGFLPENARDRKWSERLAAAGFDVPSLSDYAVGKVAPGLVFGFTAFDTKVLAAAFERMLQALQ